MQLVGNLWIGRVVGVIALLLAIEVLWAVLQQPATFRPWPLSVLDGGLAQYAADHNATLEAPPVRGPWYPPRAGLVNNLTTALTADGVYGFRFYDGSTLPDADYGVYNWCNMPHVRADHYPVPPVADGYRLRYIEVVHRHHKRTPYAANGFPREPYAWDCRDAPLHHFGWPTDGDDTTTTTTTTTTTPGDTHLQVTPNMDNPFVAAAAGLRGSCRFPQLTHGGLADAWQHGADLYAVYHDLLGFLPALDGPANTTRAAWAAQTAFRVTNNPITAETATMVWGGMLAAAGLRGDGGGAPTSPGWSLPFAVEPAGLDSLEPQYRCPDGAQAFAAITSVVAEGDDARADSATATDDDTGLYGLAGIRRSREWDAHLTAAAGLFRQLDAASGVPPHDRAFHESVDHYYDSLSARLCHGLPGVSGVDRNLSDTVFRLGQWEYSRMYRDDSRSLGASAALWGVWVSQLAGHLRAAAAGAGPRYRHNVAHDGSLSRLLSILQTDDMVWPGMGSEVVVELWERPAEEMETEETEKRDGTDGTATTLLVRVLFGGAVLRSSHPALGLLDMQPLDVLLDYLDDLVGPGASLVPGKCNGSLPLWPDHPANV